MGGQGSTFGSRAKSFSISVVVWSLIVSTVGVLMAPPAHAADPGTDKLVETLGELATWTAELGSVGKLADVLPAVQASPGAVLGFEDLVQQFLDHADGHTALSAATTDAEFSFSDRAIDLGDGRSGTLSSSIETLPDDDKQVDLTLVVERTVSDQALSIPLPIGEDSNAPQSAFSSQGGVDLSVAATLSFRLVWDQSSDTVHLVTDETTPSVEVGASASLGTLEDITAAIGILGVSVIEPSSLALTAGFQASFSDPDNDGRLAFEETDGSAGELAQEGSLEGLVDVGFADPAGSLSASITLDAAPTVAELDLPAISATIDVAWLDIATGSPTVTPTGIDAAGKFLNMTPRDIADGLGQLATALTSIQRAGTRIGDDDPLLELGNLDLPFVKGSLADAVKINEIIVEFLADNTISAEDDPAAAGNPTFVSLQEFFDRIADAEFDDVVGATLDISDIDYVDADSKLAFTLSLARAAGSPVALNAAGAAASGGSGSSYAAGSLTDPAQSWVPDEFAGHRVVAGSSAGTVLSNTATTLTLDPNGWTPTQPADGSPYTISGMQGDVGTVQLGDALLDGGKGIRNANAVNATAQVTPSYEASITLVLDLQPPTILDPPEEYKNPDGSAIIVSALPLGADRVLLRTADTNLFRADFPIDATIDIFANAGFLQVQLVGEAHVCHSNAGSECDGSPGESDHMLAVNLKDHGDLNFGEVVSFLLNDPAALLDFDVQVRAFGEIDVSVPGTTDFFPGATAGATFSWNDLRETEGPDGPQFDVSDLSELTDFDFDPANPQALFSIILKTLQTLNVALADADPSGAGVFSEEIPLVGRSLRDLLKSDESGAGASVSYGAKTLVDNSRSAAAGNAFPANLVGRSLIAGTQVGIVASVTDTTLTMASDWKTTPAAGTPYMLRSELDDVISILESSPADNLQELVRLLDDRLSGTPISFEYQVLDSVPSLVVRLDWQRSYSTSAPVQLDFDLPIGDYSVAGVEGKGSVAVGASGGIDLGLVVPLEAGNGPADAGALKVLDDSSINVRLDASVEDAHLASTIGPLKLSLGDPSEDATDKATAKASYSIDLAKSGGTGAASTFAQLMDDVGAELNQDSDAVDCGFGGSTDLALCATLPLYVSTDGGTTYDKLIDPGDNAFNLRLPKQGDDLADHFDLDGAQIDGHDRLETPDPGELGDAILEHLIDFTQITGIDGYLQLIEQALNAASFGGKLPLIGEDLQQGADFVGELRETINAALAELPADGNLGDTQGIRDWVNDELAQKLDAAGMNPDLVRVDTECSSALTSPTPTVTPSASDDEDENHPHTYAVVSYQHTSDGVEEQAMPAIGSTATADFAAVGGDNSNALSWTAIAGAAGYKVYREVGGTFQLLSDVGTATSYTDDGSDAPDATENPTNPDGPNPKKRDCPWEEFDAVKIRLDVGKGAFDGAGNLTCPDAGDADACIEASVPLDIGIPGLSLRGHDGSGPEVQVGYNLHFAFGISRERGFFVDTESELDGDSNPIPELAVGLNFAIPGDLEAELAFINITAHDCTSSDEDVALGCGSDAPATVAPLFAGTFAIDLVSGGSDPYLTIADLQGASLQNLFDVKLSAEVAIDWLLKAKVGDDAGFPGIQAELRLSWSWDNQAPGDGGGANPPSVEFVNVAIDAGEIFGQMLEPIVREIKKVTGPIDPVIETLYEPLPVLSDLSRLVGGDDVTLVSIAKAFSTIAGGPDLTFVDTVLGVVAFINNLPECTEDSCLIPIGDFSLSGDRALNTSVTPTNTESLIDTKTLDGGVTGANGALEALDGMDSKSSGSMTGAESQSAKAGFSFPVFEKPATLFNLLLGGDVDLVKFDSGPLTLGFEWRQSFGPVYAPPPVNITLSGSASVTMRIVAGFDTYGIRKAFEKSRNEDLDLADFGNVVLQSLFFYTTDDGGKPIPVVTFRGEIAAGAEVSAVIIKVGIEGGVALTISFLWNDPNNDGKFRISEFLQAALNNPICLFTVSGRISVFLRAYVTLGFSPFEVSFSFTIVDATLLDFSATPDCDPPPPELGGLTEDETTLVVYAASLDGPRGSDYVNQDDESIKITSLHDYPEVGDPTFAGVSVSMLGIRREYRNPNIERVIVDGHSYTKPMNVMFMGDGKSDDTSGTGPPPPTAQFALDAIVLGGTGDDTIKVGIGNAWIDGGGGDDVIVTGDRTILNPDGTDYLRPDAKVYVAGGGGDDTITVGNGDNVIAGDSKLTYSTTPPMTLNELINDDREAGDPAGADGEPGATVTVPDWTTFSGPDDDEESVTPQGEDTIKVGLGASTAYGNGGDDRLSVAPDSPLALSRPGFDHLFRSKGATLVGGTGSDRFAGGDQDDTIITGPDAGGLDTDPDADGGLDPGSTNTVDTGTGNDKVYGSTGEDFVLSRSKPDQSADIRGGAGSDVLVGGYGTDKVFGGPGNDHVIAEPSDVGEPGADHGFGPERKVTHRALPDGVEPSYKVLVGGTGNDHIFGGDGGADIDGDRHNPTERCGPGAPVASDPVDEGVNTPQDGNDKIIGGAGVDNIRAGGGNDHVDAKGNDDLVCGESGNDLLRGGTGFDSIWGGGGKDVIHGDAGNDELYGNDGDDTIYGGSGADVIEGNDGTDWISGGAHDDIIIGGTRAPGRPDQRDFLFGDTGSDTIIGDNGDIVGGRWYPLDLDGLTPTAGGSDLIFGGSGEDVLYGGLDDDFVFGGDHADQIEGNNGADFLYGGAGADNIIGGSSEIASGSGLDAVGRPDGADTIFGGAGDDVIAGDNAIITDNETEGSGHPATRDRGLTVERDVQLLDLGFSPTAGTSGGDTIDGGLEADVIFGQGGVDTIRGDFGDDYIEGGPGADFLYGDVGDDDIVGGSSTIQSGAVADQTASGQPDEGDHIEGGAGDDVVLGDNGLVRRDLPPSDLTQGRGITERAIELYDLGDDPEPATSGADLILGRSGVDVLLGQDGDDRILGNDGDDYLEGGPGRDWLEGNDGDDDIVGGSSTIHGADTGDEARGQPDEGDVIFGGDGDDVIVGDNARITRVEPFDPLTDRIGSDGELMDVRSLRLLDLSNGPEGILGTPSASLFGDDQLSGGAGVDVLMGQDGDDRISGGDGDDYAEGNGGADHIWGDLRLDEVGVELPAVAWPGAPSDGDELHGVSTGHGQDDLMGGSSRQGFRDGGDVIHGNGAADYILGDNGTIRRFIDDDGGTPVNRVYAKRYPTPAPADAAYIRVSAPEFSSTRFCDEANAPTCEPDGAHGDDQLFGDDGDDVLYGQDGDDLLRGGAGDDDMYGGLGDDEMYGDGGDDAMVGDRGGIVSQYEDGSRSVHLEYNQVPKIVYDGFLEGTVTRIVDLQHDVNGDVFVDNDGNEITSQTVGPDTMPFDGVAFGGNDRMRGGFGRDSMHGGFGDDLMNGDSGGDVLFGGDGADVMWGGKGCDPTIDTLAVSPDCWTDGAFDPSARGDDDRMVDHLFGGKGATEGPSVHPDTGVLGSDILDWRPRGGYAQCTTEPWPVTTGSKKNAVTNDPCVWFEMTDTDDDDVETNQHHQGIDWIYGGWDRDVMQADVADNGPNPGDRLIDWNGAYNLYSHCNAAYGGFNDVRQHSPDMESFLQIWAFTLGAGLVEGDVLDPTTSAFNELALVYKTDAKDHGSGKAYPTTPGHFDDPNACAP